MAIVKVGFEVVMMGGRDGLFCDGCWFFTVCGYGHDVSCEEGFLATRSK